MRQCLSLLLWMFSLSALAQPASSIIIEGRVTDAVTKEAVPYASVGILGSTIGTSTNADGYFTLRVPSTFRSKEYALKISCVGYDNEVIKNPEARLDVSMNQSKTMLKNVVVFDRDLSPEGIVRRAFRNVKRNYYTKPFVYQTFYRHYCKDNSVYGRLIEAAVEVYKRNGYKVQQPVPGWKEDVRVNQLRRSYDNTKVARGHVPIALYSVMATDPVGYQVKSSLSPMFKNLTRYDVSNLRINHKDYTFALDGITEYDGEQVYIIGYKWKRDSTLLSTGILLRNSQEGTLYINTKNYAIVKTEQTRISPIDTLLSFAIFKKVDDKYFLYHSMKEGRTKMRSDSVHNHHLELITTDIITKGFKPFKGREPGREELFSIEYDSTFWDTYNVLKATPLEESIVADLEKSMPLSDQFKDYMTAEKEKYFSGKEDEEKFNQFLEANRGKRPIYIDFWASWCGPCLREMPSSMELVDKYKGRIAFVYLSLDDDIDAWKKAIKKHNIDRTFMTHHFRIGSNSDAAKLFSVDKIPRYILIDKQGNYVNLDARRPSSSLIHQDLDRLLAPESEK